MTTPAPPPRVYPQGENNCKAASAPETKKARDDYELKVREQADKDRKENRPVSYFRWKTMVEVLNNHNIPPKACEKLFHKKFGFKCKMFKYFNFGQTVPYVDKESPSNPDLLCDACIPGGECVIDVNLFDLEKPVQNNSLGDPDSSKEKEIDFTAPFNTAKKAAKKASTAKTVSSPPLDPLVASPRTTTRNNGAKKAGPLVGIIPERVEGGGI